MSIESKIAEILAESKAAKLEDQVMAEDVVEEISEEELKAAPKAEEPSNKKNNVDKNPQGTKAMKEEASEEEELEEGVGDVAQKAVNVVKKVAGVATGAVGAATGAMDGAVKGARKNYQSTAEAVEQEAALDLSEDMDALFNGEELTEDFKAKATTIFEAAVMTRVNAEVARIEEEFEARLQEEAAKNKEGLVDQVDGYLGYVAEQWMKNNELALESGMKAEILEGFVGGLKGLFEEHYIDIPEERFDVLGTMEQHIEELEEKLNEQVAANVEMTKVIAEQSRKDIIKAAADGLSDTQVEKFAGLAEELTYEDAESFAKKVSTIRENYFSGKKPEAVVESVVTDEPVEVLTEEKKVELDPMMARFVAALNKK